MRGSMFAVAALAALGGCADTTAMSSSSASASDTGVYDCRSNAQNGNAARGNSRLITLHRDPASGDVMLNLGFGQAQPLAPVAGTAGSLYANDLFAWRSGKDAGTLTDVEKIETYACHKAPPPREAMLPGGMVARA